MGETFLLGYKFETWQILEKTADLNVFLSHMNFLPHRSFEEFGNRFFQGIHFISYVTNKKFFSRCLRRKY